MPDDGLDEAARTELAEEDQRHRSALRGLTIRDTPAVVEETRRHQDRVREIMRRFARRPSSPRAREE
jgi:hypothetical protein